MSTAALLHGDLALLRLLLRGEPVSLGLIRYELGADEQAVHAGLQRLVASGCGIEQTGTTEYQLVNTGLQAWEDYLAFVMRDSGLPTTLVRVFRQTASTQDFAKTFAPQRALVLADHQSAGRGRLGRRWLSSPGSCVLMSAVWPITPSSTTHDRISMLAGVAVARAVERLAPGVALRLKWPNDVMVGGRKIAGILIEVVAGAFVIGIGMNVSQTPDDKGLREIATSLGTLGSRADRLLVVQEIVGELDRTLTCKQTVLMLDEWRARAALGQTQTFEHHGRRVTGEVLDLDPDHGLVVRRDTGEIVTLPAATTSVVS